MEWNRDRIEKMIGSMQPDMEEKMRRTPMLISHTPYIYFEILLVLEREGKEAFQLPPYSNPSQSPSPTAP
jgi:hypothetical protein